MNTQVALVGRGRTVDRAGWTSGAWDDEDDRYEGHALGFPAVVWRHPYHGHLNGYLGIPPGHPWHGLEYDDIHADVHGGLTYASEAGDSEAGLPHPDGIDVWWIGFDCHHAWDYAPGFAAREQILFAQYPELAREPRQTLAYRDLAYVTAELENLATEATLVI